MTWEDRGRLHQSSHSLPKSGAIIVRKLNWKEPIKLTEATVGKLKIPRGKNDETWFDSELKGFGVRKRGQSAIYILQYQVNGKTSKLKLGRCSEIKCDVARELAKAKGGEISKARLGLGVDPAIEREKQKSEAKKPKPKTLGATVEDYLEAKKSKISDRYEVSLKYHLETLLKRLHGLVLSDVTRMAVAAEIRAIAKDRGAVTANRARGSLSAFFRWAIGEGLCDSNPVTGTNEHEENGPRKRVLSDVEAAAVWLALPDNDYGRIVRLLMLTACRREEIGSLRWSEIDFDARTITLPATRTKNKQQHVVPLCDTALKILKDAPRQAERDFVFGIGAGGYAGWSKGKTAVDEIAKLKTPWTIHDIRRTVRTGLAGLGVLPWVAEAVLNHLPPKLVRTYAVSGAENETNFDKKLEAEKRIALDLWANHLTTITLPAKARPISVRAVPADKIEPEAPRATFADRLAASAKKDRRDLH